MTRPSLVALHDMTHSLIQLCKVLCHKKVVTYEGDLLLLSHFSRVRLCVTPETAAHQAPLSLVLQARTLEWAAISFSNA